MTVRLTALFRALESGGLAAITIFEPNLQRARLDSNLRAPVSRVALSYLSPAGNAVPGFGNRFWPAVWLLPEDDEPYRRRRS